MTVCPSSYSTLSHALFDCTAPSTMNPNNQPFANEGYNTNYPYQPPATSSSGSSRSHRQGHHAQPYPPTNPARSAATYTPVGMPHASDYSSRMQPGYYNPPHAMNTNVYSTNYPPPRPPTIQTAATYTDAQSPLYSVPPVSPTRPTVHHRRKTSSSSSPFTTQPMAPSSMSMSISPPQSPTIGRHTSSSSRASPSQEKFICDLCNQSFSRAYDRKRHQAKHAPTRPEFQCSGCGQTYSRADSLKRHTDSGCAGRA